MLRYRSLLLHLHPYLMLRYRPRLVHLHTYQWQWRWENSACANLSRLTAETLRANMQWKCCARKKTKSPIFCSLPVAKCKSIKNKASWNSLFYSWRSQKRANTSENDEKIKHNGISHIFWPNMMMIAQKSRKYQEINMKVIIKTLKKMPKHTRGKPGAGMLCICICLCMCICVYLCVCIYIFCIYIYIYMQSKKHPNTKKT